MRHLCQDTSNTRFKTRRGGVLCRDLDALLLEDLVGGRAPAPQVRPNRRPTRPHERLVACAVRVARRSLCRAKIQRAGPRVLLLIGELLLRVAAGLLREELPHVRAHADVDRPGLAADRFAARRRPRSAVAGQADRVDLAQVAGQDLLVAHQLQSTDERLLIHGPRAASAHAVHDPGAVVLAVLREDLRLDGVALAQRRVPHLGLHYPPDRVQNIPERPSVVWERGRVQLWKI